MGDQPEDRSHDKNYRSYSKCEREKPYRAWHFTPPRPLPVAVAKPRLRHEGRGNRASCRQGVQIAQTAVLISANFFNRTVVASCPVSISPHG